MECGIMNKLIGTALLVAGLAFGDAGNPPARVARLNYLSGSVSFQPAAVDDWSPAALNYPMTTGDHLWVDNQSRAEMHIGSTAIHADAGTASSFPEPRRSHRANPPFPRLAPPSYSLPGRRRCL
jgi:hypothetical protein